MSSWFRVPSAGAVVGAICALTLVSAGCGGDSTPELVSVADSCKPEHQGDRVIVEGFLRLPEKLELSDAAVIEFYSLMGGDGDSVPIRLEIGDGPNQLRDLPSTYTASSLRVGVENDDRTVSIIDRVRVTADSTAENGTCLLTDPVIERTDNSTT